MTLTKEVEEKRNIYRSQQSIMEKFHVFGNQKILDSNAYLHEFK